MEASTLNKKIMEQFCNLQNANYPAFELVTRFNRLLRQYYLQESNLLKRIRVLEQMKANLSYAKKNGL